MLYADRQAEHHVWPIAGGWLDQTQALLDFRELWAAAKLRYKRNRGEEKK